MTDEMDAREQLSEMTETTKKAIGCALYRDADLDALYRECPTAFWLAPDADLSIPPERPAPPEQIVVRFDRASGGTSMVEGRQTGTFAAMVVAGPAFTAIAFALSDNQPGENWWEPFVRFAGSIFLAPLTVPVGAVLGLIPILFGTLILSEGGALRAWMQRRATWVATGALLGLGIAAMVDVGGPVGISLVVTSMLCAAVARHMVSWSEPELA